ncbi:MAG: sugar phosphate isomerase/epimerase family protein [Pirellulales bacterium]
MTLQPALSQVCSLHAAWEQDIEDYAAGACRAVELWLGKLEGWLHGHSLDEALAVLARHEVTAPVASFQGGLLISQGDARREHWQHFSRRLEICRHLGVQTLVVAGDLTGPLGEEDIDRARTSLRQAARQAGDFGVRLAWEFQSQATLANNVQTALALLADAAEPNLGLCLDIFHYYTGPSKFEDLAYLTPHNLFHVQLCDLSGQARELATDADRILPGDGDFQLQPIVAQLQAIGYRGHVSVELMNPQIWRIPPRQFGEIAITALRRLLGQASMG